MKILHTADIHLKEYKDDKWETLEKLIEIGHAERIDLLVISGDLFDKGIDAENLRPKIRAVISGRDFKTILVPGNHDYNCYSGRFFGSDVRLADMKEPLEYEDVRIWGMPFEAIGREEILSKIRSLGERLRDGKKNILLYHGELLDTFFSRSDFGGEGDQRYMPVKVSYFGEVNIDYVLAGHFHSRFDVRELDNGGYFVYPGSPISITRRETGQRKVNILEVGEAPEEYSLDTPHYEEIVVELDPFEHRNPLEIIEGFLKRSHHSAKVTLKVSGFVNCEEVGMNEQELGERIEEIASGKCLEPVENEISDIRMILEDDLFRNFQEKLENTDHEAKKKKQIRDMAIKAMMESG